MKKFLLSLLCLAGFTAAQADEVAFVADGATYEGTATEIVTIANNANGNIVGETFTSSNITITHQKVSSSSSNVTNNAVRWYQGDIMTFTPTAGTAITKVEAIIASGSKGAFSATTGTVEGNGTTVGSSLVWTGESSDPLVLTAAKQVRFSYMVVTYSIGEVTTVSQPAIEPAGGEITADTEISISCATEGASIYYTIDGTDPTAESTLYEAPFTLAAEATVKAIAVKDGLENSSIASAEFTFPCANIAEFISDANNHATTITGPVTVVAQSGSYLFIQDNSGKMIAFGSLDNTYNNGDQLSNIKGTYTLYNGLPEMNVDKSSFGTATAGAAVEPTILTVEELAIDNLLTYIKLEGVTISNVSGKNGTITDETGSIALYNTLAIDLVEGENLTVVGFISYYNTTLQVMPLEITSASGLEVVEAPVINPNGGSISKDQTIEITCATEGASIYYTIDGNDPTAESTLYEAPFTLSEECTVKAIAIAEGMENSSITEAAFTFLSDDTKVVTYNFTDPSSLTPAQETPAVGGDVVINDVEFTNGSISLVCAKNSAGTDCRLYNSNGNVTLRTYRVKDAETGATITISAKDANISSIQFDGASDSNLIADCGTLTGSTWTGESNSVVFTTVVNNATIKTITVTYVLNDEVNAIEDVEVESNEAVEYYNLQGVKVDNPENGLYIRKQGSKATKVLVK